MKCEGRYRSGNGWVGYGLGYSLGMVLALDWLEGLVSGRGGRILVSCSEVASRESHQEWETRDV